jgi:hypothetical protein
MLGREEEPSRSIFIRIRIAIEGNECDREA